MVVLKEDSSQTALVTGGAGFIGSYLVDLLVNSGFNVYVVDSSSRYRNNCAHYFEVDILSNNLKRVLAEIRPSFVYHLAGTLKRDSSLSEEIIRINSGGTRNLLDAIDWDVTRSVVCTSTGEVYNPANSIPYREDSSLLGVSVYSRSKILAEGHCQDFIRDGKNVVIVRPALVYGPRQVNDQFLPSIFRAMVNHEKLDVTGCEQRRDFIFVEDVVKAFFRLGLNEDAYGKTFNIGPGVSYKLIDIVRKIESISGSSLDVNIGGRPYRNPEFWDSVLEPSLIKSTIDWNPEINLDEGLRKTIDWWISQTKNLELKY